MQEASTLIRFHFIREKINEDAVVIEYVSTIEMLADVFTKGLPKIQHYRSRQMLNLEQITN